MPSYSFCVPKGWRSKPNASSDIAVVCDTGKACETYFGAPPKGLAFLFIKPVFAEGSHAYDGPRDMVAAAPHAGRPVPEISEVELASPPSAAPRKCFVTRRLLPWADAWDEVYGLEVNKRLFSIWTRYENNPKKLGQYRDQIRQLLTSLTPK
jgi:hypothetical protein